MMASLITGDNNTPLESDMSADTEHVMQLVLAQRLSTFHLCRLACVSKALHTALRQLRRLNAGRLSLPQLLRFILLVHHYIIDYMCYNMCLD